MAERKWEDHFFPDEPNSLPVNAGIPLWVGIWPGKGTVRWANGTTPNDLNPRLTTSRLRQPEIIDPYWDDNVENLPSHQPNSSWRDRAVSWSLFAPSAICARDRDMHPAPIIPVTLLLGRGSEEIGYGLRVFFERAGTGALFCLSGRESKDAGGQTAAGRKIVGGRWNVGVGQRALEAIFRQVGLN